MLIGDGAIPRAIIEKLDDRILQVFMEEPDPGKWPPELELLAPFLPEEEKLSFRMAPTLARHDDLLSPSLGRWASAVWKDLREEGVLTEAGSDLTLEKMVDHVKKMLVKHLGNQ